MIFLTQQDLEAGAHGEIIQAVTRGDTGIIDLEERGAIDFVAGYLSARYDTQALFSATDTERSPVLIQTVRDILLYNLYSRANPQKMSQTTADRYDAALLWLKDVQAQTVNPVGFPLRREAAYILASSNPKNENHY